MPDATTVLGFRHLLEEHRLSETIFETVNSHLRERGLLLNKGSLTDATIIAAPPSTKSKAKRRDPEMHQTRKGKQCCFGMKTHIVADADSRLVHTVVGTAANVSDVTQTEHLLHGEEKVVFADAGYICSRVETRMRITIPIKNTLQTATAGHRNQIHIFSIF